MASPRLLTFGERVRHARLAAGLSQAELAKAIGHISKTKTSKALVSQWELGRIANPQNATVLALSAVTGFAEKWLITGKGPEKPEKVQLLVAEPEGVYGKGMSRALLRRAIIIACGEQSDPAAIADAAIEVAETLADEPDVPDGALKRIARMFKPRS